MQLPRSPSLAARSIRAMAALISSRPQGETYPVPSTVVGIVTRAVVAARESQRAAGIMRGCRTPCELRPPLRGHASGVESVVFLVNGRLVSSSRDGTLRIWDTETGKSVVGPLAGHTGTVSCVAAHGSRIALCSSDGMFRVWDANSGKVVLGPITAYQGKDVCGIAYSRDGTFIATTGNDNRTAIWYANTGAQLNEMVGHAKGVMCLAFSEDGTRLVSGSRDRTVRIWDVASGKCIGEPLTGHTEVVTAVCFSLDDKQIFSSSYDETIRIWDLETRALIVKPLRMYGPIHCMALSPDGKRLVSGSRMGRIAMWDVQMGAGAAIPTPFKDHQGEVYGVVFSPDGRKIASASEDKTIALWDATDDWKRWDLDNEDVENDDD